VIATGLVAAAWAGPLSSGAGGSAVDPAAARSYVVRGGDTLWAIAVRLVPGHDPRPVVDAISEANGVDAGALVPGQTLVIPSL
jgi:nucleoid-associated protein YgaU